MLKVFLVEDEFVMREGIKNNIDWNSHGYEFCGEASDGELAFPMIQKLNPDIVITDIKMPFMDGLELSRLIKKELPFTEIIILSGYEEFEYAKEAIKIGVSQYLTKPINGEELLREVDLLAEKISEKRKEREIREKYVREMEENFLGERKNLFQYLVTGSKSMSELLEISDKLNIDLSAIWYRVALVKIQSMNHARDEYSNSLVQIEQKLKAIDADRGLLVFDRNLEGQALIFKADSREELDKIQNDYLGKMRDLLGDYTQIRYFVGIGMPVNRLSELPSSFEQASHAFAHRYLVKESCIWNYEEMEQNVYHDEEFNISNVNPKQLDRSKLREFLKFGDKEEVIYFVEEYFKDLGPNAMKSNMFRQYIILDAYFCVVDFLDSLQLQKDELEPLDITSGILQSEETAIKYVIRIIEKALELREKTASNRYGGIVDEVKKYIDKNYADEDLSLNVLASHVNFSPNHLSMVFSQQTGKTFIKYLTDFRMSKAKELLRCTGKRSSEISLEVGYKDPHYFSYLFKKTQGMTPTQYRGGKSQEGEE
ncbi:MAG: response regulator [Bacillota bacterium]|nr:response regulator [Bacillota bacterium]